MHMRYVRAQCCAHAGVAQAQYSTHGPSVACMFGLQVEKVERQLNLFAETLDEWVTVQKAWMYLEPIFRQVWGWGCWD